jgi:hypothetical protein
MAQRKINKVVRQLKKASKTHAGQAKTLESIKMKEGGAAKSKAPSNVTNPSLYARVKAEAKRKFKVFPSAYASAWLVRTYKKRGGKYKGAKKAEGGEMKALKPIPAENKGLPKLPKKVRNKMGFMKEGGKVKSELRLRRSKLLNERMRRAMEAQKGLEGRRKVKSPEDIKRIKDKIKERERERRLENSAVAGLQRRAGRDRSIDRKKNSQDLRPKRFVGGGSVMVQSRGCGAIMQGKQKKTRVPRS